MDEMNNYVFNHLPVKDVTNIVSNYVYTSLFGFFKSEYTKYYNEKQDINYSFFKVLDKCKTEFGGFTITITANGELQQFEQFKEEMKNHKKFKKVEKKYKDKEQDNPKYNERINKQQEKIKQYNDTLKISISYEDSCVLYLTNTNWNEYRYEQQQYNNLLFMGPVTHIGENWLDHCNSLVSVDFLGLNNLTTVGNNWLYQCSKLVSVDCRGLTNLQKVGRYWLCPFSSSLENVFIHQTFPKNLKNELHTYLQFVDSTITSLPYNEFTFFEREYSLTSNYFLSNYYISEEPLIIRGERWFNIEHYIMAMKYRGPKATPKMIEYSNFIKNTYPKYRLQLLGYISLYKEKGESKDRILVRKLINKYKNISIRKDWDLAYIVVVIDGLYHKFNQYKNLKEKIMRIPDNTYIVAGRRENKLGKILTAFINVIKHGDCSKMSKELLLKIKY